MSTDSIDINEVCFNAMRDAVKQIFDADGTDKATRHSYQRTYAAQFIRLYARHITGNPVRVGEIGVQRGNSIRAMRKIVPFASVYGFDVRTCPTYVAGASLIKGDAYSSDTWKGIPNDFDLIIDDGSHYVGDMLRGIPVFIEHLRPGAVLIIEDIQNDADASRVLSALPGSHLIDTRKNGAYDDLTVIYEKPYTD